MAYAQFLAGMAFNNASLGYVMRWRTSWAVSTICRTVYVTRSAAACSGIQQQSRRCASA